jgi:HEAT repeat protein
VGEFLLEDLRTGDAAARTKAAEWLYGLPVDGAPEALLVALGDRTPAVRTAAAAALGRMREPRAIDPLVSMLAEPLQSDRVAAAEALRAFGPAAVPALLQALAAAGPHREDEILNVLADIADPRAIAAVVAAALPPAPASRPPGGASLEEVDARARRERAATRLWAIETLGKKPTPEALPALEKGARDRDPAIRAAALTALARQATAASFKVLRGLGSAATPPDESTLAARAALTRGYADLAGRRRLSEWLAEPICAVEFVDTVTVATRDATGGWNGVLDCSTWRPGCRRRSPARRASSPGASRRPPVDLLLDPLI